MVVHVEHNYQDSQSQDFDMLLQHLKVDESKPPNPLARITR